MVYFWIFRTITVISSTTHYVEYNSKQQTEMSTKKFCTIYIYVAYQHTQNGEIIHFHHYQEVL